VEPQNFAARVKDLAAQRGISVAQVGFQAYDPDVKGTNPDTMKSVMAGRRHPTPVLIEAVARVLAVTPDTFGEYRLALARRQLDEREVGLADALANLERIEAAMQTRPRRAARRASVLEEASPQPHRGAAGARRTRKAS
jgi:transcriptional regulator with XRE-family HTH domain